MQFAVGRFVRVGSRMAPKASPLGLLLSALMALLLNGCGYGIAITTPPPTGPSATAEAAQCSPSSIPPNATSSRVGQPVVVCYRVATVGHADRSDTTFLNSKSESRGQFVAVIFRSAKAAFVREFGDLSQLRGKLIEVSGRVQLFEGAPEIILNNTSQLRLLA